MGYESRILSRRALLIGAPVLLASCGVTTPAVGRFTPKGQAIPLPRTAGPTNVTLRELEGMLVGLRGTPVVLNMWASWCVPCRAEAPILERAYRSDGKTVTFVGVASRDRYSDARAFMDEFGVTYVNLFDEENALPNRLQSRGFPTTIALDTKGHVRASSYGGLTEQRLAAMIQAVSS